MAQAPELEFHDLPERNYGQALDPRSLFDYGLYVRNTRCMDLSYLKTELAEPERNTFLGSVRWEYSTEYVKVDKTLLRLTTKTEHSSPETALFWYTRKDGVAYWRLLADPSKIGNVTFRRQETVRVYRYPGRDITHVSTEDPNTYRIHRIYSNHRAIEVMHQILSSQWSIRLETEDIKAIPWSKVTVVEMEPITSGGSFCHMSAEFTGDYTVKAAFRKDKNLPWTLHAGKENLAEKTRTVWTLFRARGDMYPDNDTLWVRTGDRTYRIEHGESYIEHRSKREGDVRTVNYLFGNRNRHWRYYKVLSKINPIVHLLICVDDNGRLRRRIVVKWCEEHDDEPRIYQKLQKQHNPYILGLLGTGKRPPAQRAGLRRFDIRMFLEYAPLGTLKEINKIMTKKNVQYRVPEFFLWVLMRNLVSACQSLEEVGEVDPDMKWDNVFLKAHPKTSYPAYPTPVLADFDLMQPFGGMAFDRDPDEKPPGTLGWYVPEAYLPEYKGLKDNTKLHVFSIALIVWTLIIERDGLYEEDEAGQEVQAPYPDVRDFAAIREQFLYSYRLMRLLEACLQVDPGRRWDLAAVGEEVAAVLEHYENLQPGLDEMVSAQLPEWWRLEPMEDEQFSQEARNNKRRPDDWSDGRDGIPSNSDKEDSDRMREQGLGGSDAQGSSAEGLPLWRDLASLVAAQAQAQAPS